MILKVFGVADRSSFLSQASSQSREKGFSSEVEKRYKQQIADLQKELDVRFHLNNLLLINPRAQFDD